MLLRPGTVFCFELRSLSSLKADFFHGDSPGLFTAWAAVSCLVVEKELLSSGETITQIQDPVGPGWYGTQNSVSSVCALPDEKFRYLPPKGVHK